MAPNRGRILEALRQLAMLALVPVLATGQHMNVDVDAPVNQLRITPSIGA